MTQGVKNNIHIRIHIYMSSTNNIHIRIRSSEKLFATLWTPIGLVYAVGIAKAIFIYVLWIAFSMSPFLCDCKSGFTNLC